MEAFLAVIVAVFMIVFVLALRVGFSLLLGWLAYALCNWLGFVDPLVGQYSLAVCVGVAVAVLVFASSYFGSSD